MTRQPPEKDVTGTKHPSKKVSRAVAPALVEDEDPSNRGCCGGAHTHLEEQHGRHGDDVVPLAHLHIFLSLDLQAGATQARR